MINWEEFWEKICGWFCTAYEARKCVENFAQFFSQFFAQTSARVIKICCRNFALGKVRRNRCEFWFQELRMQAPYRKLWNLPLYWKLRLLVPPGPEVVDSVTKLNSGSIPDIADFGS